MSEENEVVENEPVEQVQETPEVSPAEAKARAKGWVGLEEWKGQGKDANDWVPYKFFNEKGEMIGQIQQLKKQARDFDNRLSQNNEYWKSINEIEKANLVQQRNEAIENADVDTVNKLDKQIGAIDKQQDKLNAQAQTQIDPADLAVENEYFTSLASKPKQLYAADVAAQYVAQGLTGQDLVDAVDVMVKKEFPPQNPRRNSAPVTDSTKAKSRSNDDDLSLDSLSKDDKIILNSLKNVPRWKGKSDAEILKAIKDSKK